MATGIPFSRRPSLVMTQTCLLLVSGPLPQTFIQGEYISCGCSWAACCWAGAAGAGVAAGAFGAAGFAGCFWAGAGAGAGAWANTGAATSKAATKPAAAIMAVGTRPNGRADAI